MREYKKEKEREGGVEGGNGGVAKEEECCPRETGKKARNERNGRLGEATDERRRRRRGTSEKYGARNSKNIAGDIRRKGAPRTRHGKEEGRKEVWHGSLALSGRRTARGARVRVSRLVHAPSKSMYTRGGGICTCALTALTRSNGEVALVPSWSVQILVCVRACARAHIRVKPCSCTHVRICILSETTIPQACNRPDRYSESKERGVKEREREKERKSERERGRGSVSTARDGWRRAEKVG